jgi:glycosyltransferase involved in cell wall biosynthesis
MLNISILILTYNEELHIERCLTKCKDLFKRVILVDSYSTDRTLEIAKKFNVDIYFNKWPGSQSKQLNWALNNINFETDWILRLDADEYLSNSLINEIGIKFPFLDSNISAVKLRLSRVFLDKKLFILSNNISIIRLFNRKKCIYDNNIMDEKIKILEGDSISFKYDFFDHNLNNFDYWVNKHNYYATREAIQYFLKYKILDFNNIVNFNKKFYYKLPLFFRPFLFFFFRYFILFGFIDGIPGFLWHFHQCFWYRILVDSKIYEIKTICRNDMNEIKQHISKYYPLYI